MKVSLNDYNGLVCNVSGTNEGMRIVFTDTQTGKIYDFVLANTSEERLKAELDRRFQLHEHELQVKHDAKMTTAD